MPTTRSRSLAPLVLLGSRDHRDASDAEVARSLIRGEAWAVAETWHRFAPMVLMLAERALGSRSEADDLAQEVFARLFRRAHTLQDPNCLRSFVYSFAVRALKSQLRHRRLRAWLSFKSPETLVDLRVVTPDVESSELLRRFYALLDRLSPRDRLVFSLRRVEFMTVEEIASTLEISVSTVKRSMARASSRLSRWVESDPSFAALLEQGSLK
ncbi:MAG TPA: sigma-70 family RNA polymerase sigma factor [Polyangiaceae bacterium]